MTKISVALLTYNHERFIGQALDSVLSQQLECSFEIVIGDDASTDRTREIISDYQRTRPQQIRTIFPDQNLGSHGNKLWRQLLETCRGDYIALLDGDDYWTSRQKLQIQVAFLDEHPECAACFHNVIAFNDADSSVCWVYGRSDQPPILELEDLLLENLVPTCSVMLRQKIMSKLPNWWESTWMADWALYVLNARHGKLGYIQDQLGAYRIHSGGMSTSKSYCEFLEERLKLYNYLKVELEETYSPVMVDLIRKTHGELSLHQRDRRPLFERIRIMARDVLPQTAKVIAVTNRDDELTRLNAQHWWHFPSAENFQCQVLFGNPAPKGVKAAPWIFAGQAYEFRLCSSADPKALLAMVRITGSAKGVLGVVPGNSEMDAFDGPVLTWRTCDDPAARVLVSQSGGPERLLAVGAEGRQPVDWIMPGETYDFVLTDAADIALARVRFMRGEKAFVAAEAPRFWNGMRLGTTTIVWDTGDGTDGKVYFFEVRSHCPADDRDAILQLESLRKRGGEFLLFPSTAFWCLQHYQDFRNYLERTYRCILRNSDCIIFQLQQPEEQRAA